MQSPDANATTVTEERCFLGIASHRSSAISHGVLIYDVVCSLGRPWNDLATTVFLNIYMDDSINPAGFKAFDSAR